MSRVCQVTGKGPLSGNNESHAVKWFPLHEVMHLNNFRSTYRMLEKTRAMRNPVNILRQQNCA